MSYAEVNQTRGMPYGGMPHDEILYKLEVTDPELIAGVSGDDAFYDVESGYDNYARGEIIDRSPDNTFLESDHQRRDPATSRTMLNLRHSGGRGPNDYRGPQHPEMFLGFTGNDPRGRDTQPRFDKLRAQTAARGRNHEVRMGHNVGHGGLIEADRPWTGPAREYAKAEMYRRSKRRMHWFTPQKLGRAWGRNVVTDKYYGLRERTTVVDDGTEGLFIPEQNQPGAEPGWLQSSGFAPVRGAEGGGPRRVDRRRDADTAPWRNIGGDADLQVSRHGESSRRGRDTVGEAAQGGALAESSRADQEFGLATRAAATNRKTIAETMATAAGRHRNLIETARGDTDYQRSEVLQRLGTSAVPKNVQAALRSVKEDQAQTAFTEISDTARAMVRGLREGTAAGLRAVQGQGRATGQMGQTRANGATGGGLAPSRVAGVARRHVHGAAPRAAAASGLTVAVYGGPRRPVAQEAAAYMQKGGFAVPGRGRENRAGGRTKRPEFRSHTQVPTEISADASRTFGFVAVGATTGGMAVKRGEVRSDTLADNGDDVLLDGLGLDAQAI